MLECTHQTCCRSVDVTVSQSNSFPLVLGFVKAAEKENSSCLCEKNETPRMRRQAQENGRYVERLDWKDVFVSLFRACTGIAGCVSCGSEQHFPQGDNDPAVYIRGLPLERSSWETYTALSILLKGRFRCLSAAHQSGGKWHLDCHPHNVQSITV